MTIKHLSVLLAAGAFVIPAIPALSESTQSPDLNFACQNGDIPTTVAQTADGSKIVPVFHWKSEALPSYVNAEQLCNSVAAKLDDYSAQGYDLSSIDFNGVEQAGLPVICAAAEPTGCDKVLFTLRPEEDSFRATERVLTAILDKELQRAKIPSNDRGVQSISYQVDFWSLLGFTTPKFLK